jgi:hypothetical protein
MLQPASFALKFGFLVVLYLFLLWVAWSAMRDVRRGPRQADDFKGDGAYRPPAPSDVTSMYAAGARDDGLESAEPRLRVDRAPGHETGMAYDLAGSVTLGRGDVEIHLDDPFASSRHARISKQGHVLVIEDLGSTNGTYLNEEPLNGPQPLHPGDRIRIGDSEFSYVQ